MFQSKTQNNQVARSVSSFMKASIPNPKQRRIESEEQKILQGVEFSNDMKEFNYAGGTKSCKTLFFRTRDQNGQETNAFTFQLKDWNIKYCSIKNDFISLTVTPPVFSKEQKNVLHSIKTLTKTVLENTLTQSERDLLDSYEKKGYRIRRFGSFVDANPEKKYDESLRLTFGKSVKVDFFHQQNGQNFSYEIEQGCRFLIKQPNDTVHKTISCLISSAAVSYKATTSSMGMNEFIKSFKFKVRKGTIQMKSVDPPNQMESEKLRFNKFT